MAGINLTYSNINLRSAAGPELAQNFLDLSNGLSDGTKDLTFKSVNLNGSLNIVGTHIVAPLTGTSQTINDNVSAFIINPAGAILAFTAVMPANPTNGQILFISSSKAITAFTLSANTSQSILNTPTGLTLGGFCSYLWILSLTTWFRVS